MSKKAIPASEFEAIAAKFKAMKPVKNFSVWEAINSKTAHAHGVREQFNPEKSIIERIEGSLKILQVIREAIGVPIHISSGYRSPVLNKLVGGARRSDHQALGNTIAFDLQTNRKGLKAFSTPNQKLFECIIDLTMQGDIPPFKQLIHEFGTPNEPKWVHISWDIENPKKQILTIKPDLFQSYDDITDDYFDDQDQYISAINIKGITTGESEIVNAKGETIETLAKSKRFTIIDIVEINGKPHFKIK
ncbi:MAG: hypothetical protein HRT61_00805 [Ekhidna sp.]|nr:hypothetical protein [Ekhidna sp.]